MRIVDASYTILTPISDGGIKELQHIERIGRMCYKSEDKITEDGESAKKFVKRLVTQRHDAMLEHSTLSVTFVVDRGVSHEMVRHRIMSFAQESTRYCNYTGNKFGNEITVVRPCFFVPNTIDWDTWEAACRSAEHNYFRLIELGCSAEQARTVLPNSLKTEITMTGNYREWRHFFYLRACDGTGPAHPQIREVAVPLLKEVAAKIPVVFDDLVAMLDV